MMKSYLNFTSHVGEMAGIPVLFFISERGECWYDIQDEINPESLKICVLPDGYITQFAFDASLLSPHNCSVYQLEKCDVPASLFEEGKRHVYDRKTGLISEYVPTPAEQLEEARATVNELLDNAIRITQPLQDAADLNMISEEEAERLRAWKVYRIELMRYDLAQWPETPLPQPPAN